MGWRNIFLAGPTEEIYFVDARVFIVMGMRAALSRKFATTNIEAFYLGVHPNELQPPFDSVVFPDDLSDIENVQPLGGGNYSVYSFEKNSQKFVIKFSAPNGREIITQEHADAVFREEMLADAIFNAFSSADNPYLTPPHAIYDTLTLKSGTLYTPSKKDITAARGPFGVTPWIEGRELGMGTDPGYDAMLQKLRKIS